MANLILTEEEKAAAKWLDFDDVAVGKLVKLCMCTFAERDNEQEQIKGMSAAFFLIGKAIEANANSLKQTVEGVTFAGKHCGNWEILVRKTG